MENKEERKTLLDAIHLMHRFGLIYLKAGNLSIRTSDGNVLIKPGGCSYETVTEEDLAIVNLDGSQIDGKFPPSSETPMHTMIYKAFPEVNAIIHTHSPYAIICAITNTEIPIFCLEGLGIGSTIPVSEYAPTGTKAFGEKAIKALQGPPPIKVAILKNHGAIAIGADMEEACMNAQIIEKLCMIYTKAKALGPVTTMTDEQIREIRETHGKKDVA